MGIVKIIIKKDDLFAFFSLHCCDTRKKHNSLLQNCFVLNFCVTLRNTLLYIIFEENTKLKLWLCKKSKKTVYFNCGIDQHKNQLYEKSKTARMGFFDTSNITEIQLIHCIGLCYLYIMYLISHNRVTALMKQNVN